MTLRQALQISIGVVFASTATAIHAGEAPPHFQGTASHQTAAFDRLPAKGHGESVSVHRVISADSMTNRRRTDRVELVGGAVSGAIQSLDGSGAIRNLSDITVSFYRNGTLAAQVLPGSDGVFTARLAPGFYTLVAYGPGGYCTYGLEAVERGLPNEPSAEVQSAFQIESLAVPPSAFRTTYMLARKYAPGSMIGPAPTFAEPDAGSLADLSPVGAAPQTSLKRHVVTLNADGSVPGRLNLANTNSRGGASGPMTAFLVRGDAVLKQTTVSSDGSFQFSRVSPGAYSFITAGPGGFSAFSVVIAAPLGIHASAQIRSSVPQ